MNPKRIVPDLQVRCDICKCARPENKINVRTVDLSHLMDPPMPEGTMKENIRYCNDMPMCEELALSEQPPVAQTMQNKKNKKNTEKVEKLQQISKTASSDLEQAKQENRERAEKRKQLIEEAPSKLRRWDFLFLMIVVFALMGFLLNLGSVVAIGNPTWVNWTGFAATAFIIPMLVALRRNRRVFLENVEKLKEIDRA